MFMTSLWTVITSCDCTDSSTNSHHKLWLHWQQQSAARTVITSCDCTDSSTNSHYKLWLQWQQQSAARTLRCAELNQHINWLCVRVLRFCQRCSWGHRAALACNRIPTFRRSVVASCSLGRHVLEDTGHDMSYRTQGMICPRGHKAWYVLEDTGHDLSYRTQGMICPRGHRSWYVLEDTGHDLSYRTQGMICPRGHRAWYVLQDTRHDMS
jgi:hypothetical protein